MTHAPIIARAADAMLAYLRWFAGTKTGRPPRTADAILTEYAGADVRLFVELAQAAIEEANRRGRSSREAGKYAERRRGEERSVSAREATAEIRQARQLVRAALEADHRRLAEDVREQVAEAGIEISRGWFYKQVWSVVRKELGIRGAGIRAGRRSA